MEPRLIKKDVFKWAQMQLLMSWHWSHIMSSGQCMQSYLRTSYSFKLGSMILLRADFNFPMLPISRFRSNPTCSSPTGRRRSRCSASECCRPASRSRSSAAGTAARCRTRWSVRVRAPDRSTVATRRGPTNRTRQRRAVTWALCDSNTSPRYMQCDQMVRFKKWPKICLKRIISKNSPNHGQIFRHFCKQICHQGLSRMAKSGHTAYMEDLCVTDVTAISVTKCYFGRRCYLRYLIVVITYLHGSHWS